MDSAKSMDSLFILISDKPVSGMNWMAGPTGTSKSTILFAKTYSDDHEIGIKPPGKTSTK